MNPSPSETKVGFGVNPIKGPDGKWWVSFTVNAVPVSLSYAMPYQTTEEYINHIQKATEEARRNDLGLVIPK